MLRREFLQTLGAGLASLCLPSRWTRSAEPVILDGQWHRLLIVNGQATVDGVPWVKPWLTGGLSVDGFLEIRLDNPDGRPLSVDLNWARYAELKDGSGPKVFETRFRATEAKDSDQVRLPFTFDLSAV